MQKRIEFTLIHPRVLATDLDGTFIPLPGEAANEAALEVIRRERRLLGIELVYATGRHLESVREAISEYGLPLPDWLVCDVGSSIYHVDKQRGRFEAFVPYQEHLHGLSAGHGRGEVEQLLKDLPGLDLQSAERQQPFKISYECASDVLETLLQEVRRSLVAAGMAYGCIGSVDPFEHCGLLDVLPVGVSKAYALSWLSAHADFSPGEVVFSGDSGNDRAALVCGFRSILVGNGSEELADAVRKELAGHGMEDRFYRATGKATSGVLEGCRHFGLLPESTC